MIFDGGEHMILESWRRTCRSVKKQQGAVVIQSVFDCSSIPSYIQYLLADYNLTSFVISSTGCDRPTKEVDLPLNLSSAVTR